MKINAIVFALCIAAIVFALTGGSAQAAPRQIPQDLLDAKPTAVLVNLARWETTQEEKERHACITYVFHGADGTQIVMDCPKPIVKIDWAFWTLEGTPAK